MFFLINSKKAQFYTLSVYSLILLFKGTYYSKAKPSWSFRGAGSLPICQLWTFTFLLSRLQPSFIYPPST